MFNWTNPDETLAGSEIPRFTECGPYVFRARVFKEDVVFNDNFTVSYLQRRRWDFMPEKSNGSLTDQITSINVVAVALAYQLKHMSSRMVVDVINNAMNMRKIPLVVTESVENQLFLGYDDGILPVLKQVGNVVNPEVLKTLGNWKDSWTDLKTILGFTKQEPAKDTTSLYAQLVDKLHKLDNIKDRFGWWYQKNLTETHRFNVHTGEDDANQLGDIHSWDNKDVCRDNQKIHGSVGDLWPMKGAQSERVLLFIPDMCSSFDLMNSGPTVVEGIEGVKFVGTKETMGPSVARAPGTYIDTDLLTGLRNITSIVKAPVFISFPHFYEANEEYRLGVSGMKPDKEKHELWLVLQKDASIVLQGKGRIQVNIMLEPSPRIDLTSKLPTVLFPTIWFEQTGEIPPDVMDQLKLAFITAPRILIGTGVGCLIIAITFLVTGFVLVYVLYKPEPRKKVVTCFNVLVFKSKKITITVQKPTKPAK
ncbi:protein croquemort-like isoform X2 [Planococcus citri]